MRTVAVHAVSWARVQCHIRIGEQQRFLGHPACQPALEWCVRQAVHRREIPELAATVDTVSLDTAVSRCVGRSGPTLRGGHRVAVVPTGDHQLAGRRHRRRLQWVC